MAELSIMVISEDFFPRDYFGLSRSVGEHYRDDVISIYDKMHGIVLIRESDERYIAYNYAFTYIGGCGAGLGVL